MRLQGEKVVIRPQVSEDWDVMRTWPPFTDPLFSIYNLPAPRHRKKTSDEVTEHGPVRLWYTIENLDGQIIGRISLRDIDDRRSARLGITIGADWVGQGYGTDALYTFLDYFFGELGFATLYLDVAAPNRRAIRCYEKCGFRRIGEEYRDAGSGASLNFLRDEQYRSIRHLFSRRGRKNLVLFYEMRLDREDWAERRARELR